MRSRIVVVLALAAAAIKCGPPAEYCGQEICTKEQRCTPEKKCVTDGKPTLSVDTPVAMLAVGIDSVEVSGKAQDDDVPPSVDVSLDQSNWIPMKLANDGTFSLKLPLPKIDASSAVVTVRARDSKLQEVKVSRTIQVDNVPPDCKVVEPADLAFTNATGTLSVKLEADDGSLVIKNPLLSLDGKMGTFFSPPEVGGVGRYTHVWQLPIENGGNHEIVFRATDASDHPCEAVINFLVDNVKPTVSLTAPTANQLLGVPFFTAGGKFSGSASDGARLLKSVTLDFFDGAGPRTANISGTTWEVNVPLPTGDDYKAHTPIVVATDQANNSVSAMVSVIVDVKPPALTFTAPAMGAKLNISNFATSTNAPLQWVLTDGDPVLDIVLVQTDGGIVRPPSLPTGATDNPKSYSPVLRANDRAGNTSTATTTFTVDRVAPTVTMYTPANDTRMWGGIVTADFSEVMIGGPGLSLQPQLPGSWTTPQHFEIPGLAKDSVYLLTTGIAATDQHGNFVVPFNARFHTETLVPASGANVTTNPIYNQVLDAQADSEGVLNVLGVNYANNSVDWIQLDSRTMQPKVIDTYPNGNVGNLAVARTIQSDLSSRRIAGVWFNAGAGDQVRYNINGGAHTTVNGAQAFIPTPAFAGEPGTGLAEVGFIIGGAYTRQGRPNLGTSMTTGVDAIVVTDTRWELARFTAGGTESQSFGCPGGNCVLTALKPLGGAGNGIPNTAGSRSCSIHGYLNGATEMTTLFRFQPGCGGTNPCAPDVNEMGNFDDVIADPGLDGTFYGYTTVSPGVYQVKKRVLAANNCSGAITNLGLPVDLGAVIGIPRIAVIRGVPGLVYADSNRIIKFVGP